MQTTVRPRIPCPKVLERIDRQRAGRLQHDAFDVQHLEHGDAQPVLVDLSACWPAQRP
jgi:hypothetical protein